jgi:hypothetical protein
MLRCLRPEVLAVGHTESSVIYRHTHLGALQFSKGFVLLNHILDLDMCVYIRVAARLRF